MYVVVAGTGFLTECIVGMLCKKKHDVVVVSEDLDFCERISCNLDVEIVCGDPTKLAVLEEAQLEDFDACIALTGVDADNLAICQLCREFFDIQSLTCIVSNPGNAGVFTRLGIEGVVDSTLLLAHAVADAAFGCADSGKPGASMGRHAALGGKVAQAVEAVEKPYFLSSFHRMGKPC